MYSQDKKWTEAKKFIKEQGMEGNWIEVVDYYRQIKGKHVAVFVYIDKTKYRILEATVDNRVVLMDVNSNFHLVNYEKVLTHRKEFFYIEKPSEYEYTLPDDILEITYSKQQKIRVNQ